MWIVGLCSQMGNLIGPNGSNFSHLPFAYSGHVLDMHQSCYSISLDVVWNQSQHKLENTHVSLK